MSFRIIKPRRMRKTNYELKNNPPYVLPSSSTLPFILGGAILKPSAYSTPSHVIANLSGAKIVPDISGYFGWSVDTDKIARYAVVGAPIYNSMTGFAKIYSIQNNVATLLYTTSQEQTSNNMIGFGVAISGNGNTIAVGVPGYNSNRGAVLIYSNNNGTVSYVTRIDPTGVAAGDYAGQFVKLNYDGTVLSIGAPLAATNAGKVWLYKYTSAWSLTQTISAPVGVSYFGDAITMNSDGTRMFISSKLTSSGGITCRAYNYNYSTTWSVNGFVSLSITTAFAISSVDFDIKMSDDAKYLFISSPNQNDTSGIVKISTLNSSLQEDYSTTLSPDAGETGFGYRIALSGDGRTLYVSSVTNDSNEGEIWIYRQSEQFPKSWIRVLSPFRGANDIGSSQQGFSIACSFDGSSLVIGGPYDDNNKGASWSFI